MGLLKEAAIGGMPAEFWINRQIRIDRRNRKGIAAKRPVIVGKLHGVNGMTLEVRPPNHNTVERYDVEDIQPLWSASPDLKILAEKMAEDVDYHEAVWRDPKFRERILDYIRNGGPNVAEVIVMHARDGGERVSDRLEDRAARESRRKQQEAVAAAQALPASPDPEDEAEAAIPFLLQGEQGAQRLIAGGVSAAPTVRGMAGDFALVDVRGNRVLGEDGWTRDVKQARWYTSTTAARRARGALFREYRPSDHAAGLTAEDVEEIQATPEELEALLGHSEPGDAPEAAPEPVKAPTGAPRAVQGPTATVAGREVPLKALLRPEVQQAMQAYGSATENAERLDRKATQAEVAAKDSRREADEADEQRKQAETALLQALAGSIGDGSNEGA